MRDNKAMCTQDPESPDLKQGDIFEFLHENRGDYRERYGVVITADCDIKKERAPFISYLPIYGMEEYAEHIWFPEICDDFVNQAKETMAERINRKRAKVSNSAKPMSSDAVAAWASRLGRDGVLNEIGVTDKGQRSDLGKHIDAYLRIVDACANGNLISKLSALCSIHNKGADGVKKSISNITDSPPDDVYFIDKLSSDCHDGYYILLREVGRIHRAKIGLDMRQILDGAASTKRISRLKDRFLFSMMRKFSAVFSDIGLPNEHKAARLKAGTKLSAMI